MRVAHFLASFDSIGETYIYNFVNNHIESRPFVVIPPGRLSERISIPGERVRNCRDWADLERVLIDERIDLVHAHMGEAGTDAILALKRLQLPLVVTFYGDELGGEIANPVKQENYRLIFRLTNRIIVLTDYHRKRLLALGCPKEKIAVIRLGVDLERFHVVRRDRQASTRLRVLSVGRLIERKGFIQAIDAFRRAKVDWPQMELFIAGAGPQRPEIEARIEQLQMKSCVFLLGALPNNMIAELMQRADIFLLPCQTTKLGDEDGSPMTLIKAQASGIPVVSTSHGGISELIIDGETGLLVDEGNLHEMSRRLVQLAADPELRLRLGKNGRDHVAAHYNIVNQVTKLEALYREVADESVWYRQSDYYLAAVEPDPKPRKVLVLHDGPLLTLFARLCFLRDRYPKADVSVVMVELHPRLFEELPFVERIYSVPDDLVTFLSVSRRFIWKLRRRQFDIVVVSEAYVNADEVVNLKLLALACGGKQTLRLMVGMKEAIITMGMTVGAFLDRNPLLRDVRRRWSRK